MFNFNPLFLEFVLAVINVLVVLEDCVIFRFSSKIYFMQELFHVCNLSVSFCLKVDFHCVVCCSFQLHSWCVKNAWTKLEFVLSLLSLLLRCSYHQFVVLSTDSSVLLVIIIDMTDEDAEWNCQLQGPRKKDPASAAVGFSHSQSSCVPWGHRWFRLCEG